MIFRRKEKDVLDNLVNDIIKTYKEINNIWSKGEIDRKTYYLTLLKTAELTITALLTVGLNDKELRGVLEEISDEIIKNMKEEEVKDNAKKIYG